MSKDSTSATHADGQEASTVKLPESDLQSGVILPNGDINWDCPCLGGMPTGPCGAEFKESFSCFALSQDKPDSVRHCLELFKPLMNCMQKFPDLYKDMLNDDKNLDESLIASEQTNIDEKPKIQ